MKVQGAPPLDSLPSPASADPAPPVATLVRPGVKSQLANSTVTAVAMNVGKAMGTPWAFRVEGGVRRRRGRGFLGFLPYNAQFEAAKKMLLDAMSGA